MNNELDNFEEGIKNSIENFEMPYDAQSWENMNAVMQTVSRTRIINNIIAASLVAAGLFFGGSTLINEVNKNNDLAVELTSIENTPTETTNSNTYLIENTSDTETSELNNLSEPISSETVNTELTNDRLTSSPTETNNTIEDKVVLSNSHFTADIGAACIGTTVEFNVTHGTQGKDCLWNFGDGSFSTEKNPEHVYSRPGIYDVSLSVSTNNGGNIESTSIKKMIRIEDKPLALFEWNTVNGDNIIPTVNFANKSLHAKSLRWYVDGEYLDSKKDIDYLFKDKGEHVIKLLASNDFGCVDSTVKHINIEDDFNLFAPKAITPNGDNKNDVFMPKALSKMNRDFELKIFDQNSGELIFVSHNVNQPWKGYDKNTGEKVIPEGYAWVVTLDNGEEFSGIITVIP